MRVAVLTFPGSNCDGDCYKVFSLGLGLETEVVWHKETSLEGFDLVCVPGGFSYGDYLRCGAIARFSPVMKAVQEHSAKGGLVVGICNGFQILCEVGLLPGALIRNSCLEYRCITPSLKVENASDTFNQDTLGSVLSLPIGHGEGNYRLAEDELQRLEDNGQVLLRYCDEGGAVTPEANPNGSVNNIAGIRNEAGNVFGMMPHPDRAFEPHHPSQDGLKTLRAILDSKAALA